MKRLLTILFAAIIGFNVHIKADEGMWLLTMLDQLNMGTMTEMGLKLSADEIYNLNQTGVANAVVSMGRGFCTGEIVSSKGLLFTNYHCGRGFVQSHSSVEHDYLKDGFWAKSIDEELANPGLYVRFLIRIEDVTEKVLKDVKDDMSEQERADVIGKVRTELQNAATEGNHYSATVSSFFGGNNYYLIVYESFNDVRLVGAPPESIGEYGGDTDNWEWPRHTGDFSIFRVYSGPDGLPAEYSEENIPLKPKAFLPVSIKGLKEGDFAMTFGYAGNTTRYKTSYEIEEDMTITHPNRAKLREIVQDIWIEDMIADQKVYIQYFNKHNGSANYWKNSIGMMEAINRLNVKADKEKIEKRFAEWVNAKPKRQKTYGEALDLIKTSVAARANSMNLNQYMNECFGQGTELTMFSLRSGGLVTALKSDDSNTIERAKERLLQMSEAFYKDYNPPTDLKTTAAMFSAYKNDIDKEYWPAFFTTIDEKYNGDVAMFVKEMFDNSIYSSEEKFMAAIENPTLDVFENDPAYKTASDIRELAMKIQGESDPEANTKLNRGRRLYIAGLREMDPEIVKYPDANSSMRLSYGSVKPYQPKDAVVYKWYTTDNGIMEKYKPGDHEFDLKQKQIDLINADKFGRYADENGYLPVCFLTTNDITGGNSGSPVINGNGELIGLAFDGNWEALSGDIIFNDELQRCINVDIRYVLWVIDVFAGAQNLIDEMEIRE
ncbi:MAG: S46 family peptidase [Marinilabiliaceae bacterium]|jgi:hypothetical protein|nr:S46 family peptidase [Marinilabiliaceae bacterium]